MKFKTSILDHVTSVSVERANRKASVALVQLNSVLKREVFSPTVRSVIIEAAEEYASARQGIMEAKVGEEASQFVDKDMQMLSRMTAIANGMAGHGDPEGN